MKSVKAIAWVGCKIAAGIAVLVFWVAPFTLNGWLLTFGAIVVAGLFFVGESKLSGDKG